MVCHSWNGISVQYFSKVAGNHFMEIKVRTIYYQRLKIKDLRGNDGGALILQLQVVLLLKIFISMVIVQQNYDEGAAFQLLMQQLL